MIITESRMLKGKKPSAFIRNTFAILESQQFHQIVGWTLDNAGFIIHDLQKFQTLILPLFFKHQKYTSFVRQLNMYGFHKQKHASSQHYFEHETYRRGQNFSIIRRKPEKKKKNADCKAEMSNSAVSEAPIKIDSWDDSNPLQGPLSDNNDFKEEADMDVKEPIAEEIQQLESEIDESEHIELNTIKQAVFQNQILRGMDGPLKKISLHLKKYRKDLLTEEKMSQFFTCSTIPELKLQAIQSDFSHLIDQLKLSTNKMLTKLEESQSNICM